MAKLWRSECSVAILAAGLGRFLAHIEEQIFLACDRHHGYKLATISQETYDRAKEDPRAIRQGFAEFEWGGGSGFETRLDDLRQPVLRSRG